jgi:hypothetical protein
MLKVVTEDEILAELRALIDSVELEHALEQGRRLPLQVRCKKP